MHMKNHQPIVLSGSPIVLKTLVATAEMDQEPIVLKTESPIMP